jgi:hypothetical protein
MEARLDAAELEVKASCREELTRKWQSTRDDIHKAWQALAEKLTPSLLPMNPPHLDYLQTEYQKSAGDIEAIIGWSQLTAAQREQLRQQSEITSRSISELKEAMFWMDDTSELTEYCTCNEQLDELENTALYRGVKDYKQRSSICTVSQHSTRTRMHNVDRRKVKRP